MKAIVVIRVIRVITRGLLGLPYTDPLVHYNPNNPNNPDLHKIRSYDNLNDSISYTKGYWGY